MDELLTDIADRLETIHEGRMEKERRSPPSRCLEYCITCDEWSLNWFDTESDEWHRLDCANEHYSHIVRSDYEETSLDGFEKALRHIQRNYGFE